MGLGFQTAVDQAGSALKTNGFKYDARVLWCGGEVVAAIDRLVFGDNNQGG